MRITRIFLSSVVTLMIMIQAQAETLPVHDLNPLTANIAMPALPAAPTHALSLTASIGNISLDQQGGNEHLQLDAERREWTLSYLRPVNETWTMGLELPWVQLNGGTLDHLIESWHHLFGFPNGNRASWPTNRLLIQHDTGNQTDLRLTHSASGMGDISLHVGKHWLADSSHPVTLWLSIKAPTGSDSRLLGSGGMDIAVTLSAEQHAASRLNTFEQITLTHVGNTTWLNDRQRQMVANGVLGASLRVSSHWQFITQLNAHSALYDSDILVLGKAVQLSLGPRYSTGKWQADFAIAEDLVVDTAPDVQFVFQLGRRW